MARRPLTPHWSVELGEEFESRVLDGDLQLVSAGPPVRTVWASVYAPPLEMPLTEILSEARDYPEQLGGGVEVIESASEDELRLAHWYGEEIDGRLQHSLFTYTARRGELVSLTFISDSADDKQWALDTWATLEFQRDPHPESFA
ncbi:hypothetical protein LWF01_09045 [Saxibacter everestensis]|uniref:DUF1795 domain-containing protein n=1 Tax=Saxibacter everestensis TaxID=2909229 RepID=A0ABY8QXW8_9MICO|nr:hypothetical protein LWF01_09045 [Brevibacteriaceae bacterium ZFBP1038]